MKKNATLEIIERSEKVSLYSISFEKDGTTEFERFMQKFDALLHKEIDNGTVSIEEKVITGIEDKVFRI